jgi:hypothetical protein
MSEVFLNIVVLGALFGGMIVGAGIATVGIIVGFLVVTLPVVLSDV